MVLCTTGMVDLIYKSIFLINLLKTIKEKSTLVDINNVRRSCFLCIEL